MSYYTKFTTIFLVVVCALQLSCVSEKEAESNKINLSGEWSLRLDSLDTGAKENWQMA